MTHDHYQRMLTAINRRMKRELSNDFLQFNNNSWVDTMSGDEVHWTPEEKKKSPKETPEDHICIHK